MCKIRIKWPIIFWGTHTNTGSTVALVPRSDEHVEVRQLHLNRRSSVLAESTQPLRCIAYAHRQGLGWQPGDILAGGGVDLQIAGRSPQRGIWRFRPSDNGSTYAPDLIFVEDSSQGMDGLAFDPFGRLYFSEVSPTRRIYRVVRLQDRLGTLEYTSIPADLDWGGNFTFSPAGFLYISSGNASQTGRIFKLSQRAKPPSPDIELTVDPGPSVLSSEPITVLPRHSKNWVSVYEFSQGPIYGFSFYDHDRIIFADGGEDLRGVDIDSTLRPPYERKIVRRTPRLVNPAPFDSYGYLSIRDPIQNISVTETRLDRYLSRHAEMRTALRWLRTDGQSIGYDQWADDPETNGFRSMLNWMYAQIASGEEPALSYMEETDPDTGEARIGPRGEPPYNHYTLRDASEIYLARVAHSLWVEIEEKVPWRLYDYGADDLARLLDAAHLFEVSGTTPHPYHIAEERISYIMPVEPVQCYRFLTGSDPAIRQGDSFVKDTRRKTIFALTRWIMEHLRHGDTQLSGTVNRYGYSGPPPPRTIFLPHVEPAHADKGPRYWSWWGCQSAAGFMIALLRLVNIPIERLAWYAGENLKGHGGVDCPVEELCCWHTDILYTNDILQDPSASMHYMYNGPVGGNSDYTAHRARYAGRPANPADANEREKDYDRVQMSVALHYGLYFPLNLFWGLSVAWLRQVEAAGQPVVFNDQLPCDWFRGFADDVLVNNYGFSPTEAEQLTCNSYKYFINKIWAFIEQHRAEIDAQSPSQEQTDIIETAHNIYKQQYNEWRANR